MFEGLRVLLIQKSVKLDFESTTLYRGLRVLLIQKSVKQIICKCKV